MNLKKLVTVEETFEIAGRGLIVVPDLAEESFSAPQVLKVLLKMPEGREIQVEASIAFPLGLPKSVDRRPTILLMGCSKANVPVGTEVWYFAENDS